jgi:hypothetical protein
VGELRKTDAVGRAVFDSLNVEGEVFAILPEVDHHLVTQFADRALSSSDFGSESRGDGQIYRHFATDHESRSVLVSQFPDAPRERSESRAAAGRPFRSAWLVDTNHVDCQAELWFAKWQAEPSAEKDLLTEALWC